MVTELEQYSSGSGRIFLEMSLEDAESVSHSGQCDDDVKALSERQDIADQLNAIDPADLRAELAEYGAWDADELSDHDQNLQRLLWLAGGSIVDEAFEREREGNRVSCDQCSALMINGVFCHETGCPNSGARFDAESGDWVKQRKCFDCGCTVDADDPCCSASQDDGADTEEAW
jgi:hypothetical protein